MSKSKQAVMTLQMYAADGRCGFSMSLSDEGCELDVKNIIPAGMVRLLRQMAIDLPMHLEKSAASIEAQNASGQINIQVH